MLIRPLPLGDELVEIDREILMHLIDARVTHGVKAWYDDVMKPLHEENKKELQSIKIELKTVSDAFNKAKGAWWMLGTIGIVALALLNHYWK